MDELRKGIAIGMLFGNGGSGHGNLMEKTATENGVYTASEEIDPETEEPYDPPMDGYSVFTVDLALDDKSVSITTSQITDSQTAEFEYDPHDEDPELEGYSLFTIDLSAVKTDIEDLQQQVSDLEDELEDCHDCKDEVVAAIQQYVPDYVLPESGCPADGVPQVYDEGYEDAKKEDEDEDDEHDPTKDPGIEVPPGVDPQDVIDALEDVGVTVVPISLGDATITTDPTTDPPTTVSIDVFFAGYMYGYGSRVLYTTPKDTGYKGYSALFNDNAQLISNFEPWGEFLPNSRTYVGPVVGIKIAGNRPIYNYSWAGIYFPPEAEVVGVERIELYPYDSNHKAITVTFKHKGAVQDPWTLNFVIQKGVFNSSFDVTTYITNA